MAIGFPPKENDDIDCKDLSKKQVFILALETAEKLNWNVGILTEIGFTAYTKFSMSSWSEKIQIIIKENSLIIESGCAGNQIIDYGKNKKNISSFKVKFNSLIEEDSEDVELKYAEIEKSFISLESDSISKKQESQKKAGFLSIFKPSDGYFITPILLNLNLLIFIGMAFAGVSIMQPNSESLLHWGANFRPVTLDGEWWRLLSSCFLHIGIFHLLMNMYALLFIGVLLEPYLGKTRFISAYLLTGIAGSTASLFWNDLTISAGASGAIFGMYGVFLAMLTTNFIEKAERKSLLISIAVFVGYNLLSGVRGGIDNAAHIGGLISGLIIGYSFYPSLIKPDISKRKFGIIGLLSIVILGSTFFVLSTTVPSEISKYDEEMEKFILLEEKALNMYNLPETTSDQEYLFEIQEIGIPSWKSSLKLLERVDKLELPNSLHERVSLLKEYCSLRINCYEAIYNAINEGGGGEYEIEQYNKQIEAVINQLQVQ